MSRYDGYEPTYIETQMDPCATVEDAREDDDYYREYERRMAMDAAAEGCMCGCGYAYCPVHQPALCLPDRDEDSVSARIAELKRHHAECGAGCADCLPF